MKIVIKDKKKIRFWLFIPTAFIFNRITSFAVRKALKKNGVFLKREKMNCFIKELKKYKKQNNGKWCLAEIDTCGGVCVKIVV